MKSSIKECTEVMEVVNLLKYEFRQMPEYSKCEFAVHVLPELLPSRPDHHFLWMGRNKNDDNLIYTFIDRSPDSDSGYIYSYGYREERPLPSDPKEAALCILEEYCLRRDILPTIEKLPDVVCVRLHNEMIELEKGKDLKFKIFDMYDIDKTEITVTDDEGNTQKPTLADDFDFDAPYYVVDIKFFNEARGLKEYELRSVDSFNEIYELRNFRDYLRSNPNGHDPIYPRDSLARKLVNHNLHNLEESVRKRDQQQGQQRQQQKPKRHKPKRH